MGIKIVTQIETPRHGAPGELRRILDAKLREFWIAVGRWEGRHGSKTVGRFQMHITSTDNLIQIEYYAHTEERNSEDSIEVTDG